MGVARGRAQGLSLSFASSPAGTRLEAEGPGVRLRRRRRPGRREPGRGGPWSQRRFQYTVKDVGRPVTGTLHLGDEEIRFGPDDGSFAVLDHGRGKWPLLDDLELGRRVRRGRRVGASACSSAGSGPTAPAAPRTGCSWTAGCTRSTRTSTWTYDRDRLDGALADRRSAGPRSPSPRSTSATSGRTPLVIASEIHQCFGVFTGWVLDDSGTRVPVDGLVGWAEEARNRW